MALNLGYEYSIDVSIDNNINARAISNHVVESKVYIFIKLQTKFKVMRKLGDEEDMYNCEMMEKECLTATFFVPTPHGDFRELFNRNFRHINFRLREYLMPNDQILLLIHQVFDFTEQIVSVDPFVPIVPIVVDVDVCTIQLDGETINQAFDRSVRPDSLTPLEKVWPMGKEMCTCCRRLRGFLLYVLPRVGVDKGSGLMEECPICMGGPSHGAMVSWLPCKHAFHSHCVVRWLMKSQSCPFCRHEIELDKGGRPKEMGCYVYADTHYDILNSDI